MYTNTRRNATTALLYLEPCVTKFLRLFGADSATLSLVCPNLHNLKNLFYGEIISVAYPRGPGPSKGATSKRWKYRKIEKSKNCTGQDLNPQPFNLEASTLPLCISVLNDTIKTFSSAIMIAASLAVCIAKKI